MSKGFGPHETVLYSKTSASMKAFQDKLKNHLTNLGTLKCEEALTKNKRVCRMLGLLRKEDEHQARKVFRSPSHLRTCNILSTNKMKKKIFHNAKNAILRPTTLPGTILPTTFADDIELRYHRSGTPLRGRPTIRR